MKLLLIALAFLIAGCTPSVEVTTIPDAQQLVNSLVFVKGAGGLCYGVSTVSSMSTRGALAQSLVLVNVDCKAVGL